MPEENKPSATPQTVKPTCPECGIELVLVEGQLPKKCEKCGFRLAGFQTFQRWFKAAQKEAKKGEEVTPQPKPTKKDDDEESFFDALL